MGKNKNRNNNDFFNSLFLNDTTFQDYFYRLKRIATSIFEWVNLPHSMNPFYLEECLFYKGVSALLYDKNFGYINTDCSETGDLNIYNLPTKLRCFAYNYEKELPCFYGNTNSSKEECILVMNNFDRIPTSQTLNLFAYRLANAERTCDINIYAQRTPILLLTSEKTRLSIEQIYNQFSGFRPVIIGDKNQLDENIMKVFKTDAPFVTDKIMEYKKEIWNEALTFLGVNNILLEKKERLISDEANSNNELINFNLQSFLAPRKKACEHFNLKYNLPDDKKLDVRVNSDLHNVIKNVLSSVSELKKDLPENNIHENFLNKEGE